MLNVLLYSILGYWALSAVSAVGVMLVQRPEYAQDERWKRLCSLPSPRREIALAFGTVVLVLIAPLIVPRCLLGGYLECRRERAFYTNLLRTHRDNVYEAIHPVNLPSIARRHFEALTPQMLALGFRELGTYILKPEPVRSFGSCFHSPDGRTVGALGQTCDSTYFSFTTLFANGMALETGSIEATPALARINDSKWFRVVFCPETSVSDAYDRHQQELAAIESSLDTTALALRPQQFREVLTYEGRLLSQVHYEMGEKDDPPPTPVLPRVSEPDEVDLVAGAT